MSFIAPKDVMERVSRNYRMRREMAEKIDQVAEEIGENQTYVIEHMIEFAFKAWKKKKDKSMFDK
ncbi:MAG: hypothetical protein SWH54_03970 [Thermodesulfobacteriota bacterium]|nr:hypothetical protein [Thermodesulfobacteriota bacterium]